MWWRTLDEIGAPGTSEAKQRPANQLEKLMTCEVRSHIRPSPYTNLFNWFTIFLPPQWLGPLKPI